MMWDCPSLYLLCNAGFELTDWSTSVKRGQWKIPVISGGFCCCCSFFLFFYKPVWQRQWQLKTLETPGQSYILWRIRQWSQFHRLQQTHCITETGATTDWVGIIISNQLWPCLYCLRVCARKCSWTDIAYSSMHIHCHTPNQESRIIYIDFFF